MEKEGLVKIFELDQETLIKGCKIAQFWYLCKEFLIRLLSAISIPYWLKNFNEIWLSSTKKLQQILVYNAIKFDLKIQIF